MEGLRSRVESNRAEQHITCSVDIENRCYVEQTNSYNSLLSKYLRVHLFLLPQILFDIAIEFTTNGKTIFANILSICLILLPRNSTDEYFLRFTSISFDSLDGTWIRCTVFNCASVQLISYIL